MAEAKVRINFNLSENEYQKLLILQEDLSKERGQKMTLTDTIIDCIRWQYNKEFTNTNRN